MNISIRGFVVLLSLFLSMLSSGAIRAQTSLQVQGTELCPQYLCPDGAIFAYNLGINNRRVGGGVVQIDHAALLPTLEQKCVTVLGGSFLFRVGFALVGGDVIDGQVCLTDTVDVFQVKVHMLSNNGVKYVFNGLLDHRPLRLPRPRLPTISGMLTVVTIP